MMEKSSDANAIAPKPENTRAGGPDDSRTADKRDETPPETEENVQRGAPEPTRSS
jgi:hypothetical protein